MEWVAPLALPEASRKEERNRDGQQIEAYRSLTSSISMRNRAAAIAQLEAGLDGKAEPLNFSIPETVDEAIVHHADSLHVRFDVNRRYAEPAEADDSLAFTRGTSTRCSLRNHASSSLVRST